MITTIMNKIKISLISGILVFLLCNSAAAQQSNTQLVRSEAGIHTVFSGTAQELQVMTDNMFSVAIDHSGGVKKAEWMYDKPYQLLRFATLIHADEQLIDPNRFPRPMPDIARVPWYKNQWFWIGVGATATVAGTVILLNQSQSSPDRPPLFLPPVLPPSP